MSVLRPLDLIDAKANSNAKAETLHHNAHSGHTRSECDETIKEFLCSARTTFVVCVTSPWHNITFLLYTRARTRAQHMLAERASAVPHTQCNSDRWREPISSAFLRAGRNSPNYIGHRAIMQKTLTDTRGATTKSCHFLRCCAVCLRFKNIAYKLRDESEIG